MGYKVVLIKNYPFDSKVDYETIIIGNSHQDWEQIYNTWLSGSNPTYSPLWKHGVYASTEKIPVR